MLIDQIHYLKSIKDQLEAENKELKAKLNALINPHNKGKQHPSQAIINRFNRKRHAIFSQTMPSNAGTTLNYISFLYSFNKNS